MVGLDGENAIEPRAGEGAEPVSGVQVPPKSVERQMPPWAPPTKMVPPVGSVGSTAIVVTRPLTGLKKPPVVGAGPMADHVGLPGAGGRAKATAAKPPLGWRTSLPSFSIMRCICSNAFIR